MEAMVEEITESVIERQNTKVSATLGYTLNLGNFQSLRVDLGVVDYTREGETTNEAMDRIYAFVENKVIEKVNEAKANLLYNEIDRNPLFIGTADKKDRSNMNATFLLVDEKNQETFDKMWKEAGISGIPGHRSVGGYRASMYNALPIESVQVLVDVMQELEKNI